MAGSDFNKKMKDALSGRAVEVSKARMEEMLLLTKIQFRKRSIKKRMGFGELLLFQIRFTGMRIWGVEIVMAFFLGLILQGFFMEPCFFTPRKAAFLLSCVTIAASILLLPFLYRSFRFQMMEVESAAYFSIRRILICRFFLFFGGEVVIAATVCIIGYMGQLVNGSMLVYVLIPLLFTGDGVLFLLKKASLEKIVPHYLVYAGALLAFLFVSYYAAPWIFDGRLLAVSLCAGAALLGYFIYQCNRLVKCPEETLFV